MAKHAYFCDTFLREVSSRVHMMSTRYEALGATPATIATLVGYLESILTKVYTHTVGDPQPGDAVTRWASIRSDFDAIDASILATLDGREYSVPQMREVNNQLLIIADNFFQGRTP
jgi:hypothetical protein